MKTYTRLWHRAQALRNDPEAFTQAYLQLQKELEREAREALYVHTQIRIGEDR